jgi:hypothetical protein
MKTRKLLCRPFDGGDTFANPDLPVTEARVLRSGVYIFLYAENGGWSYVSPTLSKEECRRLIEVSKVVFPKNVSYTYCFEVRGDEEYIYGATGGSGSSVTPSETRLFLFAVRNNSNGAYIALNNNALFKDVLVCENIPVRQGVTAATAGTANTGSWGVYVQYGNNFYGTAVSPHKKKTKMFSMGNDYHMMYRVLSTAEGAVRQGAVRQAPIVITDADYTESQKKIYSQMVKVVKKLAEYHQAKLDAIPEDATEEILLSENANDRYIVDMWTISRATGVKVTPMIYYSSLYPIFAPQFEAGGRVTWANKILMEYLSDDLENPELKPWIPLSRAERIAVDDKNFSALVAPRVTPQPAAAQPVPQAAPQAVLQTTLRQAVAQSAAPQPVAPQPVVPQPAMVVWTPPPGQAPLPPGVPQTVVSSVPAGLSIFCNL